jgi:hypothetical protein
MSGEQYFSYIDYWQTSVSGISAMLIIAKRQVSSI